MMMIRRTGVAVALLLLTAQAHAEADPENYCLNRGGTLEFRLPAYNTNGGQPLILAGQAAFCRFNNKDGSSIWALASTLGAEKPTLAALAYYAEEKYNGNCNGSPGSCYCSQLGGTDLFGGINAAGGGWVLKNNTSDVLDACIFPDRSSIDAYGLFYHSAGIIRGRDLSKVLRFKNPY